MTRPNQLRFITDTRNPNPLICGNKFYHLARIAKYLKVPKAYCLKPNAFRTCLPEKSLQILKEKTLLLKSNGGYQLNRIQGEMVNELQNLTLSNEVKKELLLIRKRLSPHWESPLIIRSSSVFEDSQNVSGAGIYKSVGNIKSTKQLYYSIKECWFSFFSLSALAHRLRIQEYTLEKLPALIIQKFMDCFLSGVVFSEDPISSTGGILVEYSDDGLSDSIESGKVFGKKFKIFKRKKSIIPSENDLPQKVIKEIANITEKITTDYGKPMEFEWLLNKKQIYTLQARPIKVTSSKKSSKTLSPNPEIRIYKGYDDYNYLKSIDLGDVSEVYLRSINKRKSIRDLAVQHNVCVHGVTVLQANLTGINEFKINNCQELNRIKTPILTIDLGPHIRAFYAKREHINSTLKTLLQYSIGTTTFIVREFASGKFSAISSMLDKNNILVEVCRGSLIGINRGFVETNTYRVNPKNKKVITINAHDFPLRYYDFDKKSQCFKFKKSNKILSANAINPKILIEIAKFTKTVNQSNKPTSLEWSIVNDRPVFIDHTNLINDYTTKNITIEGSKLYYLSKGKIEGRALIVKDLDKLEYISSGPTLNVTGYPPIMEENPEIVNLLKLTEKNKNLIIISKYPYTAFSFLIGRVGGFIFESGPLLCHLCIVCREQKVPVAIIPNALSAYNNGDKIKI
ncbi:MAG: PEP/pyruvate-binding domain-containing protein [Candidatus Shapirobacteria bacterium]|nr:PEP/pyruvate-binding domain-containing protein [Candidatus Shapirobacteria bacterium]